MKPTAKRLIALLLCACMTVGLFPATALAAQTDAVTKYQPTDKAITIRSEAENTITILPKESEPSDPIDPPTPSVPEENKTLEIQAGTYTIERDQSFGQHHRILSEGFQYIRGSFPADDQIRFCGSPYRDPAR